MAFENTIMNCFKAHCGCLDTTMDGRLLLGAIGLIVLAAAIYEYVLLQGLAPGA
ncbi:hypothetical protein WH7805_01352 [Synechococcus sp. WH 7805]|nr:hypothetical protein WH7805_01352 [Synechococcus sp. WH 7805]